MAENPALWGEATKIIDKALKAGVLALNEGLVGNSRAMQIAKALHHAGFLDYDDIWTEHQREPTPEPEPFT